MGDIMKISNETVIALDRYLDKEYEYINDRLKHLNDRAYYCDASSEEISELQLLRVKLDFVKSLQNDLSLAL